MEKAWMLLVLPGLWSSVPFPCPQDVVVAAYRKVQPRPDAAVECDLLGYRDPGSERGDVTFYIDDAWAYGVVVRDGDSCHSTTRAFIMSSDGSFVEEGLSVDSSWCFDGPEETLGPGHYVFEGNTTGDMNTVRWEPDPAPCACLTDGRCFCGDREFRPAWVERDGGP